LRNLLLKYFLIADGRPEKEHIERAVGTVLEFTPDERARIRACRSTDILSVVSSMF